MKLVSIQANTEELKSRTLISLEDLSKLIKNGKIETLIVGVVNVDGDFSHLEYNISASFPGLKTLGAIDLLKTRVLSYLGEYDG